MYLEAFQTNLYLPMTLSNRSLYTVREGNEKDVSVEIEEIDHRTLQLSEVLAEGSHLSPGTILSIPDCWCWHAQ